MIKKKKIILIILGIPIFIAISIISFMVWLNIPDSQSTIFKRITRRSMPKHIVNFTVYQYFKPTLGDGCGCISFEVSKQEGDELIKGLEFKEHKKNNDQNLIVDLVDYKINEPLYYFNNEDVFTQTVIKINQEATKFIWSASF